MPLRLTRAHLPVLNLLSLVALVAPTVAMAGDGLPVPLRVAQRGPIVREIIEERPVVREVIVQDDIGDRAFRLHEGCQAGDRRACGQLGMIIGQHQERRAEWQHAHPDMFWWDN